MVLFGWARVVMACIPWIDPPVNLHGINMIPSQPHKLSRPPVSKALTFVEDYITFITEDSGGSIWIGTLMSGLVRYDPQTKKALNYYTDTNPEGGFNDQSGWAAYTSKDGVLWISTWQKTIFRVDPQQTRIQRWAIGKPLKALYKDQHDHIWLGSDSSFMAITNDKKIIKTYHAKDIGLYQCHTKRYGK